MVRGWASGSPMTRAREAMLVGVLVALAFAVYATLALRVSVPRVFPDELIYTDAAGSLIRGLGLSVRGGRESAYQLIKTVNAFLYALAAVPIYLLARRLLSSWWSLGVAALSLAIPSSVYVSVVMTESVSFLVACTALYAMALALERPTLRRQLATLFLLALSYAARSQLVALAVAYLVALAVRFLIFNGGRERPSTILRRLWPTWPQQVSPWLASCLCRSCEGVLRRASSAPTRTCGAPTIRARSAGGSCTAWPTSTSTWRLSPSPSARS